MRQSQRKREEDSVLKIILARKKKQTLQADFECVTLTMSCSEKYQNDTIRSYMRSSK